MPFHSGKHGDGELRPEFCFVRAILTVILLPPLWFLSIPALVFSVKARKYFNQDRMTPSFIYASRAKRLLMATWAIFLTVFAAVALLWFVSHLSVI